MYILFVFLFLFFSILANKTLILYFRFCLPLPPISLNFTQSHVYKTHLLYVLPSHCEKGYIIIYILLHFVTHTDRDKIQEIRIYINCKIYQYITVLLCIIFALRQRLYTGYHSFCMPFRLFASSSQTSPWYFVNITFAIVARNEYKSIPDGGWETQSETSR